MAPLAAQAALLDAAEGRRRIRYEAAIEADHAALEPRHQRLENFRRLAGQASVRSTSRKNRWLRVLDANVGIAACVRGRLRVELRRGIVLRLRPLIESIAQTFRWG